MTDDKDDTTDDSDDTDNKPGPGRPLKPAELKKTEKLVISLTPGEYAEFVASNESHGEFKHKKLHDWARAILLAHVRE